MNAIVVEDNVGIRTIVTDLLAARGHDVTPFADAESAWAWAAETEFDLAVLDWGLPGIDGLELCRRLRHREGGERGIVLMLTGRAEPDDLDEVVAAGANDYVTKPFRLDALETRVAFAERQVAVAAKRRVPRGSAEIDPVDFRSVVESLPVLTYIKRHSDDALLYVSPQIERLTGWATDMVVSGRVAWLPLIHEEDRAFVVEAWRQATARGEPFRAEYRYRTQFGADRWLSDQATPVFDEHGLVRAWHGVMTDISDRKAAETALRASDRRHRELSLAAERQAGELRLLDRVRSVLSVEIELAKVFRVVVEATADILGYQYTSLYMRDGDHLVLQHQRGYDDESRIYYTVPVTSGVSGGVVTSGVPTLIDNAPDNPDFLCALEDVVYEICVPLRDGERVVGIFNVETKADRPLTDDDLRLVLGVAELINGAIVRARLYHELGEADRKLRGVLDSVQEVVFRADPRGRWSFLNRAWEEISGFTVAESLGREVASFGLPERHEAFAEAVRKLTTGEVDGLRGDFVIVTRSGEHRWVAAHANRAEGDGPPFDIIGTLIDVTERKAFEQALRDSEERYRHLALHDPLTGLPNRALFNERLGEELGACADGRETVSVLFLDLDGFKLVNDGWGHDVGDQLLIQVGERLRGCLRPRDLVARFGGDEFAIMLTALPAAPLARETAERVLAAFREPFTLNRQTIALATSIGIAQHNGPNGSVNHLLRNADTALYAAKAGGRGVIASYQAQSMNTNLLRLHKGHDLHRAIEEAAFDLSFQPSFDLAGGAIAGLDALVRWMHPEQGLLMPEQLAAYAESAGLAVHLGEAVIRAVCREIAAWRARAGSVPPVAIALTARQLHDDGLAGAVSAALESSDLAPGALAFCFGEAAAAGDGAEAIRAVHGLRQLGVGLAIDHFGAGHSSLASLADLPVDGARIDPAFVWALGHDRASTAIVTAIKTLADTMGLYVEAQGIDTADQLAQVRLAGIGRGSGHHLARPLPADAIAELLCSADAGQAHLLAAG